MLRKGQKGQSMVEMALAMPLLILILAGILDLGRAYFTYVALSDAAAEGAAYAAQHPEDTIQIVERAVDNSNGLVVLAPEMVSVESGDMVSGNPITVTVEYNYQLLTPIISSFFDGGVLIMEATVSQPIITN
jgi:hypothetical protein